MNAMFHVPTAQEKQNAINEARYLRLLKQVTEKHYAPEIVRYCFQKWGGDTPWSGPRKDTTKGKLLIQLLESILSDHGIAPPFLGEAQLTLSVLESLSCNTEVKMADYRKLLAGASVPRYIARGTEHVFREHRLSNGV